MGPPLYHGIGRASGAIQSFSDRFQDSSAAAAQPGRSFELDAEVPQLFHLSRRSA
jgi:hypothetical protein